MRAFLTIFLTLIFISFIIVSQTDKPGISVEKVFEDNRLKSIDELTIDLDNLKENVSISDAKTYEIILCIIIADKYADKYDQINKQSNSYYDRGIALSTSNSSKDLELWAKAKKGFYFYSFNDFLKAMPYFLQTTRLLDNYDGEINGLVNDSYKKCGYFFQTVEDYNKALTYLRKALEHTSEDKEVYGALLNAIGFCHYKLGNITKARNYFTETKNQAKKIGSKIRYAKALGDLAMIYYDEKDYDRAINLLLEDIEISKKEKNNKNTMYAQILLSNVYFDQGNIEEAELSINKAKEYAISKSYYQSYQYQITEILLKIAIAKKDLATELECRRVLDGLRNYVDKTNGKEAISKINWENQKEKFQLSLENGKVKLENSSMVKWTFLILSFCLFFIIVLLYITTKRKLKFKDSEYEKKVLSFTINKLKSEQKLNETNLSLDSYKIYLSEKNSQIKLLEKELNLIDKSTSPDLKKNHKTIQSLLDSHLMTEENWINFKKEFEKEYESFYKALTADFPELTESNIRIIIFQKLKFSNSETASLLGITVDAVKKNKQRLKKKLGEKYSMLFDIIENV